jgi:hypothetical protein
MTNLKTGFSASEIYVGIKNPEKLKCHKDPALNKVDASSLIPSDINEVAVCYLCLDGGDDESSQP